MSAVPYCPLLLGALFGVVPSLDGNGLPQRLKREQLSMKRSDHSGSVLAGQVQAAARSACTHAQRHDGTTY